MFWIDVSWNKLGPCRSSLDLCFINAVRLSTWAIYKAQLNLWKASNRWFKHFTPERKMHTSAKFEGHALFSGSGFEYRLGWSAIQVVTDTLMSPNRANQLSKSGSIPLFDPRQVKVARSFTFRNNYELNFSLQCSQVKKKEWHLTQ